MQKRWLSGTVMVIILLALTSTFWAQTPAGQEQALPPAVKGFIDGLNHKSYYLAKDYISPDFAISGVPPEYMTEALKRVFSSFPVQITRSICLSIQKSKYGTSCNVSLVVEGRVLNTVFELDKDGLVMSCSLFQVSAAGMPAIPHPDLPAYAEVDFELKEGIILVPVDINGEKHRFILDSGAPTLVINSAQHDSTSLVVGMGQGVGGSLGNIGTLRIGKLDWAGGNYRNFDALSMDLSHLEQEVGESFGGLLSKAELEPFETLIDYQTKKIRFYQLRDNGKPLEPKRLPKPSVTLKFDLQSHIAVFKAKIGKKTYRLGLDTGAQTNLLDDDLYKVFELQLQDVQTDTLRGADLNIRPVTTGVLPLTQCGKLHFTNMRYVFSDISDLNNIYGLKIAGLLGYPFLSQRVLSINYRKRTLSFYN